LKPVVAIDIDGTLGDYHQHFIWFASEYLGDIEIMLKCSIDMYGGEIPFSEYCCEMFGVDLTLYRQVKLAYRQGGMKRSMPIIDAAARHCWSILDAGAELWVTTTRPYLSLDNIVPDTVAWLDRYAIPYDGLLFDEDKYAVLADRLDSRRVVGVLDDLPEMYDAAAEIFGPEVPILVAGRFNKQVNRPFKEPLGMAVNNVLERIDRWEGAHD
jgi:hypothetical protein